MLSHRGQTPPEDPSVAPVELIFEAAASRSIEEPRRQDGRLVVTHAIWLCACETLDRSPVWLVYSVGADGIGRQRVPGGTRDADVVEAQHFTGCHPAPEGVLKWLRGDRPNPWPGPTEFPEYAFI
jgi:hypothetical protein